jgi:plastocyanin
MNLKRFVVGLGVVALGACSDSPYGSGGGGCTPTASKVCSAGGAAFSPVTLTVSAGTTVSWQNGDGVAHTVTNDPASTATFNLSLGSGATVTRQFPDTGHFPYHCTFHGTPGAGMHGTIIVN